MRLGLVLLCLLPLACFSCSNSSQETVPAQLKVGFAIYDFAYIDPEGASERLTTAVWYPTAMLSPRDSLIIVPCLHPVRPVFSRSDGGCGFSSNMWSYDYAVGSSAQSFLYSPSVQARMVTVWMLP